MSLKPSFFTNPFLKRILECMNVIAPLSLADRSWDNVGLLLESPNDNPTHHVLLTIDLSPKVVEEAIGKWVSVIIAYHPPLFKPINSLCLRDPMQSILLHCARQGISIYSPHSALDSCPNGSKFDNLKTIFTEHLIWSCS